MAGEIWLAGRSTIIPEPGTGTKPVRAANGPSLSSPTGLIPQESPKRAEWWSSRQIYNRGIFNTDPAPRPSWSQYHDLLTVLPPIEEDRRRPGLRENDDRTEA